MITITRKPKKNAREKFSQNNHVNASAGEALKKIGQVNRWWAKNFSGSAEKLNDRFTVPFELSSENNKTRIDFTHVGLFPGVEC